MNGEPATMVINIQDMQNFLRFFTHKRLEILNHVYKYGPVREPVLALLLTRYSNLNDEIQQLKHDKLLIINRYIRVPWKKITVKVKMTMSITQKEIDDNRKKIIDLPSKYLQVCAKRYHWLTVRIKVKVIANKAEDRCFACTIEIDNK